MDNKEKEHSIKFDRLSMYRDFKGDIQATLSVKSDDGSKIEIVLPEEPLEAIVDLVADKLAEAAKIQTDRLREAILKR